MIFRLNFHRKKCKENREIVKKMSDQRLSIQMKNRRKIAAKRVFVVFGNDDAQTEFLRFCISACGSECRGFESHRAPQRES
jgi:hypothetical protein